MEFKQAVITKDGQSLMARLLAGGVTTVFSKVVISSNVYSDSQLESLSVLENIEMEVDAQSHHNNNSTVVIVSAFENTGVANGFEVNTVGLYATDPDKGEILYSVSSALVKGYMPADTGVSMSGFNFKLFVEVGNASNVNLVVDPAAYATHADLERLKEEINDGEIGGGGAGELGLVTGTIELENTRSYPFNDSGVTISIEKVRKNLDYSVDLYVQSETGGFAGDVVVYDKQLNGFKVRFTGSAKEATVRYKLTGGF